MTYEEFIQSKRHTSQDFGIESRWLPDAMFDFQKHVAERSIRKGRYADYLDTGLGKTIIQLAHAVNYVRATNKPVLIITPLAVAFQFIAEAEKFGIDDVTQSKDGKLRSKITVCNYQRLSHFDPNDFDCVILDESSILKDDEGTTRHQITQFFKRVKYRYLFTATPSPNDFTELGTSSEALGYLGFTDMLTKFFKANSNTIDPASIGTEWVLKAHARRSFFEWVSTWSVSMRRPSDLGFSDDRFILPKLIETEHCIANPNTKVVNGQFQMFNSVETRKQDIDREARQTIALRCEKAIELAAPHDYSIYWTNLNAEADLIERLDPNAVQIKGKGMSIDQKEEILLAFGKGQIEKLVTKASITAFGLNWQHCNHNTFFPTFSQEQYYQALRRTYRFGQKRDVYFDVIYPDGGRRCLDAIHAKTAKADELYTMLNANVNHQYQVVERGFDVPFQYPSFIKIKAA